MCASFDSNLVIISCSTCGLVGSVKVTWACASFEIRVAQTHVALTQTHVALTGPTRQQVLQLMMSRLESKLAQTHVALTSPTRQQVLQLIITRLKSFESGYKLKKIWVDKGSEFHNISIKSWLQENYIEISSTNNERKSVVPERFIRIMKNNLYKYMTLISKKCILLN